MSDQVGIITGTGLYELDSLDRRRTERVQTPYGVVRVYTGRLAGAKVAHVARHGTGHARLSHQLDARASILALREVGVGCIVATTVCGAVSDELDPGSVVVFDDLYFPSNRLPSGEICTIFGDGHSRPGHWIFDLPYSESVRRAVIAGADIAGLNPWDGGTYGHVDGPRLNSRSEIHALADLGVSAVSQTGGPETVLAGEARLPFALVGFVVDRANGIGAPTPPHSIARHLESSKEHFQSMLVASLPGLAAETHEAPGGLYGFGS